MSVREVLLLGNPQLFEKSEPIQKKELERIRGVISDLHDTLMRFREQHGIGRAIAAPQIGVRKRLIYMYINEPKVFLNPVLKQKSKKRMVVWDDCMCFPDLLVKVKRHQRCGITYKDMGWKEQTMILGGDLSELLQHECDHLEGILAVSRAIDKFSFALRNQRNLTLEIR